MGWRVITLIGIPDPARDLCDTARCFFLRCLFFSAMWIKQDQIHDPQEKTRKKKRRERQKPSSSNLRFLSAFLASLSTDPPSRSTIGSDFVRANVTLFCFDRQKRAFFFFFSPEAFADQWFVKKVESIHLSDGGRRRRDVIKDDPRLAAQAERSGANNVQNLSKLIKHLVEIFLQLCVVFGLAPATIPKTQTMSGWVIDGCGSSKDRQSVVLRIVFCFFFHALDVLLRCPGRAIEQSREIREEGRERCPGGKKGGKETHSQPLLSR